MISNNRRAARHPAIATEADRADLACCSAHQRGPGCPAVTRHCPPDGRFARLTARCPVHVAPAAVGIFVAGDKVARPPTPQPACG
jgi:hypothetical protein